MNANCPSCDKPLRNLRLCPCGWHVEKISPNPINTHDFEANKERAWAFKNRAHRLSEGTEYEPGEDG